MANFYYYVVIGLLVMIYLRLGDKTYNWMNYYFFPFIGIAFLASVPRLVRLLITWR